MISFAVQQAINLPINWLEWQTSSASRPPGKDGTSKALPFWETAPYWTPEQCEFNAVPYTAPISALCSSARSPR